MKRLLGKKQDMTQVFAADGSMVPVTIVDISENLYLGKKDASIDGYQSIIMGLGKKKKPSKTQLEQYKGLGYAPDYVVESRDEVSEQDELGDRVMSDLTGKVVSVTGVTKGKGFQGGMKRWNFSGGKVTHGQSDRLRAPGSIGSGTTPGRVYKGKKMAGHMGNEQQTVKNLKVIKHLSEEKLLLIKGALPGSRGSKLIITIAN